MAWITASNGWYSEDAHFPTVHCSSIVVAEGTYKVPQVPKALPKVFRRNAS